MTVSRVKVDSGTQNELRDSSGRQSESWIRLLQFSNF